MKKIIGLTIAAILVIGLVAGGTMAYFNDVETSTGNTFASGSLNLTLSDPVDDTTDSETLTWVFGDTVVYPGMSDAVATLTINNTGTLPGYIDFSSMSVTDADTATVEPETAAGNDTNLSALLMVHMFWDVDGDGVYEAGDTDIYGASGGYVAFSTLHGSTFVDDVSIGATSTTYVSMRVNWPETVDDNDAQADTTTFTFTVELDQVTD